MKGPRCWWGDGFFAKQASPGSQSPPGRCPDGLNLLGPCRDSLCHIDLCWMECHVTPAQLGPFQTPVQCPPGGSPGKAEGQVRGRRQAPKANGRGEGQKGTARRRQNEGPMKNAHNLLNPQSLCRVKRRHEPLGSCLVSLII